MIAGGNPRQAVIQAIAEDADGVGLLIYERAGLLSVARPLTASAYLVRGRKFRRSSVLGVLGQRTVFGTLSFDDALFVIL